MASQDASSDPESRGEVVDVRILRLSLVPLPRLDPKARSLRLCLQPTRGGANTARSTSLCSQYNVFRNIPLAACRSHQ